MEDKLVANPAEADADRELGQHADHQAVQVQDE